MKTHILGFFHFLRLPSILLLFALSFNFLHLCVRIRLVGSRFDFDRKGACLCWKKMSLKSFVRELREMKDGIGSISKRGEEGSRHWRNRTMSHIAPDQVPSSSELIQQGRWANLPPELLLDIIRRVEQSETSWPARSVVVSCASVCRSWRAITKEIIRTPEQCGRLTFPISLKQVLGFYPFSLLFGWILSYSDSLWFPFYNQSLALGSLHFSSLSKGIEQLRPTSCTLAWFPVRFLVFSLFNILSFVNLKE